MIIYSDEDMIEKVTFLAYFLVRSPADTEKPESGKTIES
jgi:hypothetical protein